MIELAQLRWFGHGVKWGMRRIAKWPGKLEHREEIQLKTDGVQKKGYRRF
jgi:hypothetical protein